MGLIVLGLVVGIVIASLWIFLPLRRVPEEIRLEKKKYILSIVIGITLCTLLIIILETIWDRMAGAELTAGATIGSAILVSFTRAALLEEGSKYLFVRRVIKRMQPAGRMQYMLLAGTIGMGYSISEKVASGQGLLMIVDAVFALHIMFQFVMGYYLYEAAHEEDPSRRRTLHVKAIVVPILLHGTWDSILIATSDCLTDDITVTAVAALLIGAAACIVAVIAEIRMVKYLRRMEV